MTKVCKINKDDIDIDKIKEFANILKNDGTVIFPTETVYGLGANALSINAAKKIYKAKGRPSDNPLIVHICEIDEVYDLANDINEDAIKVMNAFWPGPITLILNKKDIVPSATSGGLNTVAIRMPSHPIARALIKEAGIPIAAPSANISGRPSPTDEENVYMEMNERVDGIILGGNCSVGLESTILDLTLDIPTILRPGAITLEQLDDLLERVEVDRALLKKEDNLIAKAPGMKYTHYSPNATVYIVSGEENKVIQKINDMLKKDKENRINSAVMCINKNELKYFGIRFNLGENLDDVAYNLFKILIEVDKKNIDVVYCESFKEVGIGRAIMNRLLKSAGYKIINA